MRYSLWLCAVVCAACVPSTARSDDTSDHFERKVRPLLINRCLECHSGMTPDGDLDLSTKTGMGSGGTSGSLMDLDDIDSSLLVERITTTDETLQMPPDQRLSDAEIADLRSWLQGGAVWPEQVDSIAPANAQAALDHWAFQPITDPTPPDVVDQAWCWNAVDRFVRAKQEAAGIQPVEDSSALTWLRRANFDLAGLPPTTDAIESVAVQSLDQAAQQQIVERLLADRTYAERWGRHWLDLARYADTSGDGTDMPIPESRFYRDWVIDAFAEDMPYDQFVIDQIAGDRIAAATPDDAAAYKHVVATGYIALSRRFGNSAFAEMHQIVDDSIDTIGRGLLGLSLGCARCHHHKFDPITMEDYYGLVGYFESTQYPHAGTEHQKERSHMPPIRVPDDCQERVDSDVAWAVADKPETGDAKLAVSGDPGQKGPVVERGFIGFLSTDKPHIGANDSGRLELARWIASDRNPLFARVMVNRLWQYHFGQGLVPNASNFGTQSPPPTHPELLDYLATEFIRSGWSIKHMHRLIMSSHTYRLASRDDGAASLVDQANQWLWHFPRQRLDAESFRDAMLVLSGTLKSGTNGRHPFKPLDKLKYTQGNPFFETFEHDHRSVYLMSPRLNRHPLMALFDGADSNVSTPQRGRSIVPLQSLYLMNSDFVKDKSAQFAQRIVEHTGDLHGRVAFAWASAYGRPCTDLEEQQVAEYLKEYEHRATSIADDQQDSKAANAELLAWTSVARTLIASNEFVYID